MEEKKITNPYILELSNGSGNMVVPVLPLVEFTKVTDDIYAIKKLIFEDQLDPAGVYESKYSRKNDSVILYEAYKYGGNYINRIDEFFSDKGEFDYISKKQSRVGKDTLGRIALENNQILTFFGFPRSIFERIYWLFVKKCQYNVMSFIKENGNEIIEFVSEPSLVEEKKDKAASKNRATQTFFFKKKAHEVKFNDILLIYENRIVVQMPMLMEFLAKKQNVDLSLFFVDSLVDTKPPMNYDTVKKISKFEFCDDGLPYISKITKKSLKSFLSKLEIRKEYKEYRYYDGDGFYGDICNGFETSTASRSFQNENEYCLRINEKLLKLKPQEYIITILRLLEKERFDEVGSLISLSRLSDFWHEQSFFSYWISAADQIAKVTGEEVELIDSFLKLARLLFDSLWEKEDPTETKDSSNIRRTNSLSESDSEVDEKEEIPPMLKYTEDIERDENKKVKALHVGEIIPIKIAPIEIAIDSQDAFYDYISIFLPNFIDVKEFDCSSTLKVLYEAFDACKESGSYESQKVFNRVLNKILSICNKELLSLGNENELKLAIRNQIQKQPNCKDKALIYGARVNLGMGNYFIDIGKNKTEGIMLRNKLESFIKSIGPSKMDSYFKSFIRYFCFFKSERFLLDNLNNYFVRWYVSKLNDKELIKKIALKTREFSNKAVKKMRKKLIKLNKEFASVLDKPETFKKESEKEKNSHKVICDYSNAYVSDLFEKKETEYITEEKISGDKNNNKSEKFILLMKKLKYEYMHNCSETKNNKLRKYGKKPEMYDIENRYDIRNRYRNI